MKPKIQTKGENRNLLEVSIYDVIDFEFWYMNVDEFGNVKYGDINLIAFIEAYHSKLKANVITDNLGRTRAYHTGRINENHDWMIKSLMDLCLEQMEEHRTSRSENDRLIYESYLNSDRLPVYTSWKDLKEKYKSRSVCDGVSISTMRNVSKLLIAAGIILKKYKSTIYLNKQIFDFYPEYRYLLNSK